MIILVCPRSKVQELSLLHRPARVVSLLDPGSEFPEFGPAYVGRHLRLELHDVDGPVPGAIVPAAVHVDRLLRFFERWDPNDSILIHCRAGISRSTATAFIAACFHNPNADEEEIAAQLRQAAPFARPNEMLIRIADTALGKMGRMSAAIANTGKDLPWPDVIEGNPFQIATMYPETTR